MGAEVAAGGKVVGFTRWLGRMPHVQDGEQRGDSTYFALGLLATLGFGE